MGQGFVGYCVHANGIHFPWNIQTPFDGGWFDCTSGLSTISFGDISAAGSPGDMWDALPAAAKAQIILVVGFLEMHGENSVALEADGQKHYVRGGKPGYYPSFQGRYPHPVPIDLWDPAGITKNLSPERKERALLAEVNASGRYFEFYAARNYYGRDHDLQACALNDRIEDAHESDARLVVAATRLRDCLAQLSTRDWLRWLHWLHSRWLHCCRESSHAQHSQQRVAATKESHRRRLHNQLHK